MAYAWTWHDGTHIIPTHDADDLDGTDSDSEFVSRKVEADNRLNSEGRGGRALSSRGGVAKRQRKQTDDPFSTAHLDSDDAGFVDTPVLAQFNFTGTCVMSLLVHPPSPNFDTWPVFPKNFPSLDLSVLHWR